MQISGNTVLITGGSSGIGLALVERFSKAKNRVIVTGRRASALEEVVRRFPDVSGDVTEAEWRYIQKLL